VADELNPDATPAADPLLVVPPPQKRRWSRFRRRLGFTLACCALTFGLLAPPVYRQREAAERSYCNLGEVVIAFHAYHDANGILPPAALHDAQGRPLLSWRVLVLSSGDYEKSELFKQFKLDEPWDSPHNLALLDRMPSRYLPPPGRRDKVPPHHTTLKVFVGPGAAFEGQKGVPFSDFPDGVANTLLFVETDEPVPWTKPEDIVYDPNKPVRVRGLFRKYARACFVDRLSYRYIPHDADQASLRAAITRNGGEKIELPW
jgi:hypothetical protein